MKMPRIKPEDKTPIVNVTLKLRADLAQRLAAYAKFLDDSSVHYIAAAALSDVLDGDKEFQKFLAASPDVLSEIAAAQNGKRRGRPSRQKAA
jgi:hypothetical protein